MNYYERALELRDEIVQNRRYIHQHAEVGLDTPVTRAYVMEKLKEYGLEPKECGHGVTATLGSGGKTILLRADMDALPMTEESGLEYASVHEGAAHTCGHDLHAAMLLTAAKMLKESESELEGTVKFMFQPAEENFLGSKDMIANGILEGVDAALGLHVGPGKMPAGIYMYNNKSAMMNSADGFRISITGRSSHGAYPHKSIDPINIGVHIHLALQSLISREADPAMSCVMTVGKFQGGTAANQIPDTCLMEGSIRTNDKESRNLLTRRLEEVVVKTAEMMNGKAEVEWIYAVPPLVCDPKLTDEFVSYIQEVPVPNAMPYPGIVASASEDFAVVAEQVPASFIYLSSGFLDERGDYPSHHSKVLFNEDVLPIGASYAAHCAAQWLKNNK